MGLVGALTVVPAVTPVVVVVLHVVIGVNLVLIVVLQVYHGLVEGVDLKLLLIGYHPVVDVLAQYDLFE